MKYFVNCKSLDELKKEFRRLAMENHPDRGGDAEVMALINAEYEKLFPVLKLAFNRTAEVPTHETADSFRNEFYTQHGWKGRNYDSRLTTKEITAKIREYVKKAYPDCKFSVSFNSYSGGSHIDVSMMNGPYEAFQNKDGRSEIQLNHYYLEEEDRITEWAKAVMIDVNDVIKSYRYDDSDGMIDYFDTNFYYSLYIGKWNRPYEVNNKVKKIVASDGGANTAKGGSGIQVVNNEEKNGIELYFDEKPCANILMQLKEMGFRWHRAKKCWYSKNTESNAKFVAGLCAA